MQPLAWLHWLSTLCLRLPFPPLLRAGSTCFYTPALQPILYTKSPTSCPDAPRVPRLPPFSTTRLLLSTHHTPEPICRLALPRASFPQKSCCVHLAYAIARTHMELTDPHGIESLPCPWLPQTFPAALNLSLLSSFFFRSHPPLYPAIEPPRPKLSLPFAPMSSTL